MVRERVPRLRNLYNVSFMAVAPERNGQAASVAVFMNGTDYENAAALAKRCARRIQGQTMNGESNGNLWWLEVRGGWANPSAHETARQGDGIGRGYANDLILDDPFISPMHARLTRRGRAVVDRGSGFRTTARWTRATITGGACAGVRPLGIYLGRQRFGSRSGIASGCHAQTGAPHRCNGTAAQHITRLARQCAGHCPATGRNGALRNRDLVETNRRAQSHKLFLRRNPVANDGDGLGRRLDLDHTHLDPRATSRGMYASLPSPCWH